MRKILFKLFYPTKKLRQISESESEFLRFYLTINLNILFIISIFLELCEIILLILPEQAFVYHGILRIFLITNLILLVLVFIVKQNYSKYSTRLLYWLQIAMVTSDLYLATALNISALGIVDYVHPFIVGLTFFASSLQFSSLTLTSIIAVTGSINLIAMYLKQGTLDVNFITSTNVSIFVLIAWFIGIMASRVRAQSWLNSREIIKQNEILDDLTKRDPMTRFYNHESILSHLDQEILVTNTTGNPLCVLILDVDDFKKINDTLGHLKGDEVIMMIAKHINLSVRVCDIIGRYGGEEFFLIFPNTNLDSAKAVSERIRSSVQEAGIATGIEVTISGGLAQYTTGTTDDIIRLADQRLYSAKRKGKNQIVQN